ncbi:hypothetical protein CEXT_15401 [Caerostris extrusa]|uniref:Uncharacterized protein n=1 Tax=Caerostris extrusa TaxID=172846 RepID=A0AAV4VCT3_CAEEX|nr:hypothetical protein CEXT_15401 [Caerostris extrusa]
MSSCSHEFGQISERAQTRAKHDFPREMDDIYLRGFQKNSHPLWSGGMDIYILLKKKNSKKKVMPKNFTYGRTPFSAPGAPATMYLVRSVSGHKQEPNTTFRKVMDDIYLPER